MIHVIPVKDQHQLEAAFEIRRKVFVEEQNVAAEEEYDEFEQSARHFLALTGTGKACGTARWRHTPNGVKLERFAVLEEERGKGVGAALVQAVLADVERQPGTEGKVRYLHAQISAMPLYSKFGFKPEGEEFVECEIRHFLMKRL